MFDGRRLEITFSEYVNEGSFARAFSITPELEAPPSFTWKRRTVTARLDGGLRENTTYRVTIDKQLRDANGVTLKEPIVFAFSTGAEINRAVIRGAVRDAHTGQPSADMDIFAYDVDDTTSTLPARPLYRTQVGDDGQFELTYLAAGTYYVVGVADVIGNRQPDERERIAVSVTPWAVAAEQPAERVGLLAFPYDPNPPSVRSVRSASSQTIEVRYTEPVVLPIVTDADRETSFIVSDSTTGQVIPVANAFTRAGAPETVVLIVGGAADAVAGRQLQIVTPSVVDSSGNAAVRDTLYTRMSVRRDSSEVRLVDIAPPPADGDTVATLTALEWPVVALDKPRSPTEWLSVHHQATGVALDFSWSTRDGRSYRIVPEPEDIDGPFSLTVDRRFVVSDVDRDSSATNWFRRLRDSELGEIATVVRSAVGQPVVVVFRADAPDIEIMPSQVEGARYTFAGLRPGAYGIRAYVDVDGNGQLSGGNIWPHRPPEPVRWVADSVVVRQRFETALPDTLNLDSD